MVNNCLAETTQKLFMFFVTISISMVNWNMYKKCKKKKTKMSNWQLYSNSSPTPITNLPESVFRKTGGHLVFRKKIPGIVVFRKINSGIDGVLE